MQEKKNIFQGCWENELRTCQSITGYLWMSLNMIRPFVINPGTIKTKKSHLWLKNVSRYIIIYRKWTDLATRILFPSIYAGDLWYLLLLFKKLKGSEGHTFLLLVVVWPREWALFQLEHLHMGIVHVNISWVQCC